MLLSALVISTSLLVAAPPAESSLTNSGSATEPPVVHCQTPAEAVNPDAPGTHCSLAIQKGQRALFSGQLVTPRLLAEMGSQISLESKREAAAVDKAVKDASLGFKRKLEEKDLRIQSLIDDNTEIQGQNLDLTNKLSAAENSGFDFSSALVGTSVGVILGALVFALITHQ